VGFSIRFGAPKCDECGGGRDQELINGLCSNCWYKKYGRGRHIWEIWSMIGHKTLLRRGI